jgi:TetR/AcrR family transcriptional repressor of nem operon
MSLGRPLAYDPEAALDAALQVFWSKGYEATSLQDLLQAMGLSKSSFYQGFGGKKELFLRCMARYRENIGRRIRKIEAGSASGHDVIEGVLLHAAAEARYPGERRRGCLLMNTATEFAQKDFEIAGQVRRGFDGLREILRQAIERGQAEGEIAADLHPDRLADYLVCSLGGIKTVVKGGADEQQVRDIVALILRALL